MYKRFRDAIANARHLVQYRKDKIIMVISYIFIFALLMATRSFIDVITYDGMSFSYQESLRDNFADVDDSCAISSGVFSCDEEETTKVYEEIGMSFYLDSHNEFSKDRYEGSNYVVVMHGESVRVIFNGFELYNQQITNISPILANLDFADQASNPDLFYETLTDGINEYLTNTKWTWGLGLVMVDVFMGFLIFLFFVMVNSFFMRRRFMMFKFRDIFVMTAYASTALFVVLIFDAMFQFSFLITLLLIFVAFRQNSQLNDELMRRVAHHQMIQQGQQKTPEDDLEQEDNIDEDDESDIDEDFKD